MRGRQTEAETAESWVCSECATKRDKWHRYRYRVLISFVFLGILALQSKVLEWSVEYLPHVEGAFPPALPLAAILMLMLSQAWIARRYGKGTSKLVWLAFVLLILIMQISGAKNDPGDVRRSLELLEMQAETVQAESSGEQIPGRKLSGWLRQHRIAHDVLEREAESLGSTRIAVYAYAIDATSDLLIAQTNADGERALTLQDQRSFWNKLGLNLSPHLVPEFVRCYREADRSGISHRGVLKTEEFRSCFGSFGGQP